MSEPNQPAALFGLLLITAVATASHSKEGEQAALTEVERCSAWLAQRTSSDPPAIEAVGLRTICADLGSGMSREIAQRFVDHINRIPHGHSPQVVVRSLGGEVDNGLKMGEAALNRGAAVHVFDFCASSCANYLFLAGSKRCVMPDSVVLFHGGIVAQSLLSAELSDAGRAKLGRSLERQSQFLKRAGISADFFETMDGLNAEGVAARACPEKHSIAAVVLSDEKLADAGAHVASNMGPQSQDEVERVMVRYGMEESTCFWR